MEANGGLLSFFSSRRRMEKRPVQYDAGGVSSIVQPSSTNSMSRQNIQSIFQITAVLAMFIGAIMASSTALSVMAAQEAMHGMGIGIHQETIELTQLGNFSVIAAAMPAIWGGVLFLLAPAIAGKISGPGTRKERTQKTTDEPLSERLRAASKLNG